MTQSARLARQTAALAGGVDVELAVAVRRQDRLEDQHLQHRTGEVGAEVLAVDDDLAGAAAQPDAGDRVLALAGGIGTAEGVDLALVNGRIDGSGLGGADGGTELFEGLEFGHSQTLAFLRLSAATSSVAGC